MTHGRDSHAWLKRGPRLLERIDKLVRAGRLTEEEATRLRAPAETGEFDEAAREIQLRHATARVNDAVEGGTVTGEQAQAFLERLANGEDPRFLRGLRRGRRRGVAGDR